MKTEAVRVNAGRANADPGGIWQQIDPVTQGRVQVLPAGRSPQEQALAIFTELRRMMALGLDPARTAVIARQWKYLDPVRAALEGAGIPVSMADEETPSLWRLRETQALLVYLDERCAACGTRLLKVEDLRRWLAQQDRSGWWPMLDEAIDAFAEDAQEADVPLSCFREWLAEWGRASRRRQTCILLLTAHRAKGMEFDHVFVLDGEWRAGQGEELDVVRRLYYVAMTRARATLTLACMNAGNPMIDALGEHACLVRRSPMSWLPAPGPLGRRFCQPGPKDLWLSFAGREDANGAVHRAIAGLRVGDQLRYVEDARGIRLDDAAGTTVARFSKHFRPPANMRCVMARVRAVVVWRKCDNAPEYQDRCRRENWDVVLPELVFEPEL